MGINAQEPRRIVILGGGYAGLLAALRLSPHVKNHRLTLINSQPDFVERIRLHQLAADQPPKRRSIQKFIGNKPVEFLQATVTGLNPASKTVTVETDSDTRDVEYDLLVYALGSYTDRGRITGAAQNAYTLDSAPAQELAQRLPAIARDNGRLIVIGGGLTAIEAASEFARAYSGLQVEMVTRGQVGADLSGKGQAYVRETLQSYGVKLREEVHVNAIHPAHITTSAGEIAADAVLWAGGFTVSPLAKDAGIATGASGRILIDGMMHSVSHPDIIAVGDAADFIPEAQIKTRMACATAMPMAAHAADNIAAMLKGDAEKPFDFGYIIRCISLGRSKGLIQFVEPDDTSKDRILTGRMAAIVKELICRFTVLSLRLEKWLPGSYMIPGGVKAQPVTIPQQRRAFER